MREPPDLWKQDKNCCVLHIAWLSSQPCQRNECVCTVFDMPVIGSRRICGNSFLTLMVSALPQSFWFSERSAWAIRKKPSRKTQRTTWSILELLASLLHLKGLLQRFQLLLSLLLALFETQTFDLTKVGLLWMPKGTAQSHQCQHTKTLAPLRTGRSRKRQVLPNTSSKPASILRWKFSTAAWFTEIRWLLRLMLRNFLTLISFSKLLRSEFPLTRSDSSFVKVWLLYSTSCKR